jgi:hypothetical protein
VTEIIKEAKGQVQVIRENLRIAQSRKKVMQTVRGETTT